MGIWSFRDQNTGKYVRGAVTGEGRTDVVGALSQKVANPKRSWKSFRLYSIPGVAGGRRLKNTIDGRWLETVNRTSTLVLPAPVRKCSQNNKDMQWKVINVTGKRGVYKLQNLRNNKYVYVTKNGLLKANASSLKFATEFVWFKNQ